MSASESRSEEHTSELQSRFDLVCRLLLEKKNQLVGGEFTQISNKIYASKRFIRRTGSPQTYTITFDLVDPTIAYVIVFFFNDAATTEIYTLSLHAALPI